MVSAASLIAFEETVGSAAGSIGEAIRHLAGHRSGRVLICGSLYFAGKVLGENEQQEGTR